MIGGTRAEESGSAPRFDSGTPCPERPSGPGGRRVTAVPSCRTGSSCSKAATRPRFVRLPAPRDEDVDAILRRVARRTAKTLVGYDEEMGVGV